MQRVAFSPDDTMLAAGVLGGSIYLLEVPTGKFLQSFYRTQRAWCVAFSPDGKALATAFHDGSVQLLDVSSRQGRKRCLNLEGYVAFHEDGKTLLDVQNDCVRSWDTRSSEEAKTILPLPPDQHGGVLSADGKTLLTRHRDGTLRIWDLALKQERRTIRPGGKMPGATQLAADGRTLCTATHGERDARLWDTQTGEPLRHRAGPDAITGHGAWLSPDSRLLATMNDPYVHVRELATGRVLLRLEIRPPGIHSVAFCRQGKNCAVAWADYSIEIANLESGQATARMHGHRHGIYGLAFSPDGKTLASASWDETVKLWHVATGRELMTLEGHQGRADFVAFSPDGRMLVSRSAGRDSQGEVLLWDARDTEPGPPP
jgi:WD40 repeat protein